MLEYFSKHKTQQMLTDIHNLIDSYRLTKENQEGYLTLRSDYNAGLNVSPLTLYTLICYAFNNQIRFNSKGEYNMPFGKNRSSFNPTLEQKFITFCDNLSSKKIKIVNSDFRDYSTIDNKDTFIYCDPPYYNSTATYNENNGWSETEEEQLRDMLNTLNSKQVKWALSNNLATNPTLETWAKENGYTINLLNCGYGNCNYHKKDKTNNDLEVLITNY